MKHPQFYSHFRAANEVALKLGISVVLVNKIIKAGFNKNALHKLLKGYYAIRVPYVGLMTPNGNRYKEMMEMRKRKDLFLYKLKRNTLKSKNTKLRNSSIYIIFDQRKLNSISQISNKSRP